MLFDTHSHLNFNGFKDDAHKVIERCLSEDIWMINVGSNLITSRRAVELAQAYEKGVYASVGLHPISFDTGLVKIKPEADDSPEKEFVYEEYKELARNPKVAAIGEIGLDYWSKPKSKVKQAEFKQKQKDLFLQQLGLAKELNLPVIIHCRMAFDDLLEICGKTFIEGVIHCFTGTWAQAEKLMELGFHIGFNGIMFKLDLNEVIRRVPGDRILVETDCPYLTPPMEEGRNEPRYIKHVAQKIAEVRGESFTEVAEVSTKNARKLFRI
ncbi:MAG: TatD family hydrolase [bacterium]